MCNVLYAVDNQAADAKTCFVSVCRQLFINEITKFGLDLSNYKNTTAMKRS